MSENSSEIRNFTNQDKVVSYTQQVNLILIDKNPFDKLHEISSNVPYFLDYETSIKLKEELDDPDKKESATNELIYRCLPTLDKILQKVKGLGVDERDLISVSLQELIEKTKSWQPQKEAIDEENNDFKLYINSCVKNKVLDLICSEYNISSRRFELIPIYFKIKNEYQQIYEKSPTLNDWETLNEMFDDYYQTLTEEKKIDFISMRYIQIKEDKVKSQKDVLKIINNMVLSQRINDSIVDENSLDQIIDQDTLKDKIADRLSERLTDKQKVVIKMAYGINNDTHTQTEIGENFGVTRGYIHVIKNKAISKLRRNASKELKDYY